MEEKRRERKQGNYPDKRYSRTNTRRMKRFWKKVSVWMGLLLFPGVFLYYEILFKLFGGISPGNFAAMFLFSMAAGGLAQMVYLLMPGRKSRFYYTLAVLFTAAIVFLVECFTGRAFQTFMTFDSLFTGAGDAVTDFGGSIIRTVICGWYVIVVFLLPCLVIWLLKDKVIFNRKPIVPAALVTVVAAVFCFLGGSLIAGFSPVYGEGYQFDLAARTFGLLTTIRLETVNGITGGKNTDKFVVVDSSQMQGAVQTDAAGAVGSGGNGTVSAETEPQAPVYGRNEMEIDFNALAAAESETILKNLNTYLASQQGTSRNEYTGLFKGKNLILICAEAFSPYAVSRELTPTLYRLLHNGFYFSDYYQPAWGGSTSTGEFSQLMGVIPTEGVKSIRKTEGHNLYLTIGNQLSRLGYFSEAYHNNSYTYYGRNKTHTNFGYSAFLGMGNGMEAGVKNCWPQSDLEMMDFTVSRYIDKQPFSVYYMTVSGHCGYSLSSNAMSKKNWEAVSQLDFSDTVKAYLASQLELEYGMNSLVTQLEKAGILEETVICMTSDHYPYGLEAGDTWGNSRNYLPELYGCEESEFNKFVQDRNGLIIWSGCLETSLKHMVKEISEPVYSLDILPTLSNLFGVEYDSRLLAGRDVFSDAFPLVIWPDYSWKTDQAVYDAARGRVTAEDGTQVSDEYVQTVKDIVKNKFNLSKVTLNYDYWGRVFGN